jgi:LAO/AO transport system kinase
MDGIDEIWQTILDHRKKIETSGELAEKRSKQALDWMWALVEEGLIDRFYKNSKVKKSLPKIVKSVKKGKTGPTVAAHKLLYLHDQSFSESE